MVLKAVVTSVTYDFLFIDIVCNVTTTVAATDASVYRLIFRLMYADLHQTETRSSCVQTIIA